MEKVRAHNRRTVADFVPSCQEKDGFKDNNPKLNFVREFVRSDIMSSQPMNIVENTAMNGILSKDVIRRIAE